MIDLTQYSDDELSLQVFNEEVLYNMRHKDCLFDCLVDFFIFTDAQKDVLIQDLQDDLNED